MEFQQLELYFKLYHWYLVKKQGSWGYIMMPMWPAYNICELCMSNSKCSAHFYGRCSQCTVYFTNAPHATVYMSWRLHRSKRTAKGKKEKRNQCVIGRKCQSACTSEMASCSALKSSPIKNLKKKDIFFSHCSNGPLFPCVSLFYVSIHTKMS